MCSAIHYIYEIGFQIRWNCSPSFPRLFYPSNLHMYMQSTQHGCIQLRGNIFCPKKKVFLSVRAIRSLTLSQYLISSPGTIHLGRLSTHIALPPTLYLERKSRSAANIIWASSPLKALGTPYQIFQGSLNPCISRSSVQRYEWAYHSAWESRQPDSTQHMQPINVHY